MKVTLKKLQKLKARESLIDMFKNQFGKEAELKTTIEWAIDNGMDAMTYANWLIVRMMQRKQRLAYAVYAAKQFLPIHEAKHPEDTLPRLTIELAEACIADDSESNREKAQAAADADYAAAYAADAADDDVRKATLTNILKYGITLIHE